MTSSIPLILRYGQLLRWCSHSLSYFLNFASVRALISEPDSSGRVADKGPYLRAPVVGGEVGGENSLFACLLAYEARSTFGRSEVFQHRLRVEPT